MADSPAPSDPIVLAAASMAFGILLGTGVTTATLLAVRTLQVSAPPPATPDPFAGAGLVLLIGTFAGPLVAVVASWTLMTTVESPYRRGMLATVAGFATVLAAIVAIPLDHYLGRPGLLGYLVLCGAGSLAVARRGFRTQDKP
jgi:hypothetical protein